MISWTFLTKKEEEEHEETLKGWINQHFPAILHENSPATDRQKKDFLYRINFVLTVPLTKDTDPDYFLLPPLFTDLLKAIQHHTTAFPLTYKDLELGEFYEGRVPTIAKDHVFYAFPVLMIVLPKEDGDGLEYFELEESTGELFRTNLHNVKEMWFRKIGT
jgi:hypothetical protein